MNHNIPAEPEKPRGFLAKLFRPWFAFMDHLMYLGNTFDSPRLIRFAGALGGNPNMALPIGTSLLSMSATFCSLERVKALLDVGAHPNVCDSTGNTPLILTIVGSALYPQYNDYCYGIVSELLIAGANVNTCNNSGVAPLKYAEQLKLHLTSELLKRYGGTLEGNAIRDIDTNFVSSSNSTSKRR